MLNRHHANPQSHLLPPSTYLRCVDLFSVVMFRCRHVARHMPSCRSPRLPETASSCYRTNARIHPRLLKSPVADACLSRFITPVAGPSSGLRFISHRRATKSQRRDISCQITAEPVGFQFKVPPTPINMVWHEMLAIILISAETGCR